MKLGFTGTRRQPDMRQMMAFSRLMALMRPLEFHHGDCVGADEKAHYRVYNMYPETKVIWIHPPRYNSMRAFCTGHAPRVQWRDPLPYLVRNQNIVNATDVLCAMPRTDVEEHRSGTWATVRYARKQHKGIAILLPEGQIIYENMEEPKYRDQG